MTNNLKYLRAVCRIETATKQPIIIYKDTSSRYGLTCYNLAEQHGELHPAYYRDNTRKTKTPGEMAACASIIERYSDICKRHGGEELIIKARLS